MSADVTVAEPNRAPFALGPNLFVDDRLIAEGTGLARTTHQPEKLPAPVLDHDRPTWFMKVLYDAEAGCYRMWYIAMGPKFGIALAESKDGIRWRGSEYIDGPAGHWGLFLHDEGPGFTEPLRRYKMAYFGSGLSLAFSADGMRFNAYADNPVLPWNASDIPPYEPGYENVISDIIDGCWDPLRKEYLLGCKIERGGYPGKPPHHAEGWRRCVGMSTSRDFITWARPRVIVTPDPANGMEEFYGFKPLVRGSLYIGFLRVLRDDLPATPGGPVQGIGWTELMTSRDGRNWTRYQEPFIDRDPREGRWDHAMAWYGDSIAVGDQEYIYFGGYRAGHKVRGRKGDRVVGMAVLRRNGFVSRDAGSEGGALKTWPGVLPGDLLTVNANVREEMRVRLLDEHGEVLPGYDWPDCVPVYGNSVSHRIVWRGRPPLPRNCLISLEFALRAADLYGFDLVSTREPKK